MTMRSTLTDTALIGTMDSKVKKGKLVLAAIALVGVIHLLRSRGSDSDASEETENEHEDENMDEEDDEIEVTTEQEQIKSSAKEELAEARRELDIFDMLAILAAAVKAARDEYRARANN